MINLKALVKNGVDRVFVELGQIVEDILLFRKSTGATTTTVVVTPPTAGNTVPTRTAVDMPPYDPVTGVLNDTSEQVTLSALLLDAKESDGRYSQQRQIAGDAVKVGDKTLLFKAADATIPIETDLIVTRISDSTKWGIVNYTLDPTETLYELHLRGAE